MNSEAVSGTDGSGVEDAATDAEEAEEDRDEDAAEDGRAMLLLLFRRVDNSGRIARSSAFIDADSLWTEYCNSTISLQ